MNNKGGALLDAIIGIMILTTLFLLLSNYTGFVVKTERNMSKDIQAQLDINNLIEYIYSYDNWEELNNKDFNNASFILSEDLNINCDYENNSLSNENVEKIKLKISKNGKRKEYTLERSLYREKKEVFKFE